MQKTILVLSSEEDCQTLRGMLSERWYNIIGVQGYTEMKGLISRQLLSVIICEACLPDGTDWKHVFETTRRKEGGQPLFVVCSKHADDRLWAEALNFGAYDVLNKPFELEEVVRVVGFAARRGCSTAIGA